MRRASGRFQIERKRRNWPLVASVSIIALIGGAGFIVTTHASVVPAYKQAYTSKTGPPSAVVTPQTYSAPVRLQIPKLKIDTAINATGLTKAGDMAVPTDIKTVGWYKYGAYPGNTGSAVIAGHLIGRKGEAGVFKDLAKLQKGDVFRTLDDKGQAANFVIREKRTYGQHDKPTGVFDASDKSYVNLITCAGDWDASQHLYADRLVVFAEKTQ